MRYFDHDTDASNDELIMGLRITHGGEAVDAYWVILEQIYKHEAPFPWDENSAETVSVCYKLGRSFDDLSVVVEKMCKTGLLTLTDDGLMSERAKERIKQYQARAKTARQNGKKGGRKPKANPEETDSVFSGLQQKTEPQAKVKVKGIGYLYGNQIPDDSGAVADKPAPLPSKAERDMAEQQARLDAMTASAVTCPEHIYSQVRQVG